MSGLYFCYICGANSKSHFGLKSHMEIIHSNQHPIFERKEPANYKLINYSCERCKTVFRGYRSHEKSTFLSPIRCTKSPSSVDTLDILSNSSVQAIFDFSCVNVLEVKWLPRDF